MKAKKNIKPKSKPKPVSKTKTVAKSLPKSSAKKSDKKKSKKEEKVKKQDKKLEKKPLVDKVKIKDVIAANGKHKENGVDGKHGSEKKQKIKEDLGDGRKVEHAVEDISKIKPVKISVKKTSPKDKVKERILARLKEKAEQAHLQRNFLPSKKKKYTLEYIIKSSPYILFEFISTSSGLALWFADEVDDHLDLFTFTWEGNPQKAELVEFEDLEYVKFRWADNPYDEYFEFRITSTEITGDTVLLITDFAEANEMKDLQLLWDQQVKALMQRLGLGN